ncbi:MAG: NAD(P)H-hydrate dehydratase [Marinobacterium sp.]|nr:NAD(P)H-hydrate dehydratase [Marinobacterium sp.]
MRQQNTTLPEALYTAGQTRLLDQLAIEGGTPGFLLMQRAARAAFAVLQRYWPQAKAVTLLCGSGNNGGDGLVLAALAQQHGMAVQVLTLGEHYAERLQGEAQQAWQLLQQQIADNSGQGDADYPPLQIMPWFSHVRFTGDIVVDAMLGTGLNGPVRGDYAQAIEQVNSGRLPVLAVDIPSGLCADTGAVLGVAVESQVTVSFIGLKRGLLTHQAVDYVGELQFDDLRIDDAVYQQVPVSLLRTTEAALTQVLGQRRRSAHKGSHGRVLVVGGDHGMGGAALIAAQAVARCGAGLITLATRAEHVTASLVRCPEVMVKAVRSGQELQPLLDKADVVVIGPGLGQSAWSDQLLQQTLKTSLPLVVDADALNLLCNNPVLAGCRRNNWIITPHPGEAARLLDETVSGLLADRFAAVDRLQQRFGGVALLKGAGSLVTDGELMFLCNAGNPGMASGGMGDMLSGITGALLAQGLSAREAARLAVWLHAAAADHCADIQGERGLLATDLLVQLPALLNGRVC